MPQRLWDGTLTQADQQPQPSQLCQWSIHLSDESWSKYPTTPGRNETPDPEDESTWTSWPESLETPLFEQKLAEALRTNVFSTSEEYEISLSIKIVAEAADNSYELLLEALGISIIAGNNDLMVDQIGKATDANLDISSIYPYHLATSYLDGAKTCCNLFYNLAISLQDELPLHKNYTNALGHTVLDNIMIKILKCHTQTPPSLVNQALTNESSFKGEEVDICGRWDADSECYRALIANGKSSVPFGWKHKLCHTATQTICHCIRVLEIHGVKFNAPSGIFPRYCMVCGEKLQLNPLHTLVLVAFQLAQSGCLGEDLFGAIACLLQLLSVGANPRLSANISLSALLGMGIDGLY